jgi:CIC family chloride channel protein
MTSVFMVLEVSGNYSIILPVMIANTLAYLISRAFVPVPIFDLLSTQDGLELPSMEEQREIAIVRVEDALRQAPLTVANEHEPIARVLDRMAREGGDVVLVHRGRLQWSAVTRKEMTDLLKTGGEGVFVGAAAPSAPLPYFYPDHPLHLALPYLYEFHLLPVVNRANADQLEGVLTLEDALRAFRRVDEADRESQPWER